MKHVGSALDRCDKLAGDDDRHVGIYASWDNWRTCYPHIPIGMLGIYQLLFVCYPHMPIGMLGIYRLLFCVCVSAGCLVTDISGVGWCRAMKFCRMVDLGVHHVISPFGELWPRS